MKNVLIIGGSGFVGSALLRALKDRKEIKLFAPTSKQVDAFNYESIESFIKKNNISIIYHAAAKHAGVGTGLNKSLFFLESNLLMNYNLVKAAYENGVEKFITFGTSCCYNNASKILMNEDDYWTNRSENTYGSCKRIMLEHLENQNKMSWVYLVPPNLYGPGDHFGEDNAHFIPATFKKFDEAIASGKNEITVWGDGSQERDFLYIDDIINVLVEALYNNIFDKRVINISASQSISIKEIVLLIQKNMNYNSVKINWDITKPTGVKQKSLDNSLFHSLKPDFVFTGIDEGIKRICKWHKNGDMF